MIEARKILVLGASGLIGRFLTEIVPFPHGVPIAGAIEYVASDGTPTTLALLQGYIENQGDAWAYTLNYVEQFLEQKRGGTAPVGQPEEIHGGYLALMRTLGQRTAELHIALSKKTKSKNPETTP